MSRARLLIIAAILAVLGVVLLVIGATVQPDIRSYVDKHYRSYAAGQYLCDGSPEQVANDLARAHEPEARATDQGKYYLRYPDDIITVGPLAGHPCTVRVEDLNSGYRSGHYVFLGPGFNPGSPSQGPDIDSGGPGGVK